MQAINLSVSKDSFLQSLKMDHDIIMLYELPKTVGCLSYAVFFLLTCCSDFLVLLSSLQLNSIVLIFFFNFTIVI